MDLLEIRDKIDVIDKEIVELFEKRMKLSGDVADYKIENGKEVLDTRREKEKISKVKSYASNEFNEVSVEELFSQIMAISRKLQYRKLTEHGVPDNIQITQVEDIKRDNVKVVYQGVPGAYSHEAMLNYFGEDVDNFMVPTWRDAMEAVKNEEADYAVLPIENSTAGMVSDVYDLLTEYNNYIVDETSVSPKHALLGLKEATIEDIKVVYSHPQGLMQCSDFLDEHKDWQRIGQSNTALSAKKVIDEQDISKAAIASENAGRIYNLKVLKKDLTVSNNTTKFIIVSKKSVYRKDAKKVFVSFELPHKSGTLYNALSHFIYNGLNMTKIESRPLGEGNNWEYRFYVEFEGKLDDSGVKNALRGLQEETNKLIIYGNY